MALPTFQAVSAVAEAAANADVTPVWPAHIANDIAILLVESQYPVTLSAQAGFREIPLSPQKDLISLGSITSLTAFWCRATSGAMANPTVRATEGDRVRAALLTFRGVNTAGVPWDVVAGNNTEGAQSTTVTVPGATTTTADCLVLVAGTAVRDIASTAQVSGWTNANLSTLTEVLDNFSILGNGGGLYAAVGGKAAAGAVGNTTATLALTSCQGRLMIALSSAAQPALDSTPYVHGHGPVASSATVDIAVTWPPHQANDIGLLIVESGGWPVTLAVAAGFVEVANSPKNAGVSGTTSGTSLSIYWKRATGAAEAAPTVDFIGDHIRAQIVTLRGVITTGDPWDVTAGDFTSVNSTSVTFPAVTTTKAKELILNVLAHSVNAQTNRHTGQANANLTELNEKLDRTIEVGGGSGLVIVSGKKAVAGDTGTTTSTYGGGSLQARMTLAFKAPSDVIPHDTLVYSTVFSDAGLRIDRKITADALVYATVLSDANFVIGQGFVLTADPLVFTTTMHDATLRKRLGRWTRRDTEAGTPWSKRSKITN